ncbi:hypothetical protein [Actinoplanes subtropicus]|uniref:hypothetical protein n=1 Tax=Actinoplanes subtropicus TaxID=543632 RepID=UPI0004C31A50|nr:hypothetical protein [Actinoplanes subtropicus]
MQLINYGTIPLGAVISGLLDATLGFRPAIWIMTAAFVLATGNLLTVPIRQPAQNRPHDQNVASANIRFSANPCTRHRRGAHGQ